MRVSCKLQLALRGVVGVALFLFAVSLCPLSAQSSEAASQAKKAPATKPKKAPAKARRPPRPRAQTAPTKDRIIEIQQALGREGFYTNEPSGKWDAVTAQAMRDFQTANGLTSTGKLGALSLQKLGLGSDVAGRGAPSAQADARPSALSEADLNDPGPEEDDSN